MKKYRFRLQGVLRVRRIQEEQAAMQLAAAQRRAEAAAAEQAAAEGGYVGRVESRNRATTTTFLANRALADAAAASVLITRQRRAAADVEVDENRDGWVEAKGRVTGLEKLDERRREEHRTDTERAEANVVDDLVTGRFTRAEPRPDAGAGDRDGAS